MMLGSGARSTILWFACVVGNVATQTTRTFIAATDFNLSNTRVQMERPTKTRELAITPTTPAEQGYIHFYSSVVKFNETDYRIYYFSKGIAGYHSHVATATTPLGPWSKPALGLFDFNGSSDNNLISVDVVLVSVFVDRAPDVPESERIKAVSGNHIYTSSDGFRFSLAQSLYVGWKNFGDTQPVLFWDDVASEYIAGGRVDEAWGDSPCLSHPYQGATPNSGPGSTRSVGTATSSTLRNGTFSKYSVVLGSNQSHVGSLDSSCVDLYTSAIVRYEDVFLIFPSAYYHFRHTDPERAPASSRGKGNDGVLAVRLAWARSSTDHFSYVDPLIPEAEWIPRGRGRFLVDDWRFVGDYDAGHVFMTWGLLQHTSSTASAEWDTIVGYHHGSQLTHGGVDGWFTPGYHNSTTSTPILSGIERLELRRDGFASLRLVSGATVGSASLEVLLPTCRADTALQLLLNAEVAVGGAVRVGFNHSGFAVDDADDWIGNDVRRAATWNLGSADLSALEGLPSQVMFKLVHSAQLYAFELRCVSNPSLQPHTKVS